MPTHNRYNAFLWLPAFLGLVVFIYGLITLGINTIDEEEVCNANVTEYTICALCPTCEPKQLKDSCNSYKVSSIFDNEATPAFAWIMAVWGSAFVQFWGRIVQFRTFKYSQRKNDKCDEHPRPKYIGHPMWYDQWIRKPSKAEEEQQMTANAQKTAATTLMDGLRTIGSGGGSGSGQLPCAVKACRNPALPGAEPSDPYNIGTQTCAKHTAWDSERRCTVYSGTIGVSIMFVMCAIVFFFSIIVYRLAAFAIMSRSEDENTSINASFFASFTASCFDVVIIVAFDNVYRNVARKLTKWENHRTAEQHEASLNSKVFIFEFINYNATLFYLAFLKGQFYGYPGNYAELGEGTDAEVRFETCPAYGCKMDVTIQLVVIMVGKAQIQNVIEYTSPWLIRSFKKCCCKKDTKNAIDLNAVMPWERDHRSLPPQQEDLNLYDDYREIFMQFGFLSLYISAFPLAPLFSLLSNLFEVRIDATKMLMHSRRGTCQSSNMIGVWQYFLEGLTWLAVLVNGGLLAFTSTFVPLIVYTYGYSGTRYNREGYIDRNYPISNRTVDECIVDFNLNTTVGGIMVNDTWASTLFLCLRLLCRVGGR
jgi:hypothetical protein